MKDLTMFEKLKDARLSKEGGKIRLNYLGDNMLLIKGLKHEKAQQMIDTEE